MILEKQTAHVERSKPFDIIETEFSGGEITIGNSAAVITMLRDGIYRNRIQVICQEIISNARDSHRAAGRENLPFTVTVPSPSYPYLRVRDFGVSMSPQEIDHVLIRMGNTTKAETDSQNGGFGIGAKSPLSYVDSFSFITFLPDEHGQMWRREYMIYIAETMAGRIDLVKPPEPCADARGVEVLIPVKPCDFHLFKKYTLRAVSYWAKAPLVFELDDGLNKKRVEVKSPIKGKSGYRKNNFFIPRETKDKMAMAILDGMPYEIPYEIITDYFTPEERKELEWIFDRGTCLFFATGELDPSPNREFLKLNHKTVAAISNRLKRAYKYLVSQIFKEAERKTLTEAAKHLLSAARDYPIDVSEYSRGGVKIFKPKLDLSGYLSGDVVSDTLGKYTSPGPFTPADIQKCTWLTFRDDIKEPDLCWIILNDTRGQITQQKKEAIRVKVARYYHSFHKGGPEHARIVGFSKDYTRTSGEGVQATRDKLLAMVPKSHLPYVVFLSDICPREKKDRSSGGSVRIKGVAQGYVRKARIAYREISMLSVAGPWHSAVEKVNIKIKKSYTKDVETSVESLSPCMALVPTLRGEIDVSKIKEICQREGYSDPAGGKLLNILNFFLFNFNRLYPNSQIGFTPARFYDRLPRSKTIAPFLQDTCQRVFNYVKDTFMHRSVVSGSSVDHLSLAGFILRIAVVALERGEYPKQFNATSEHKGRTVWDNIAVHASLLSQGALSAETLVALPEAPEEPLQGVDGLHFFIESSSFDGTDLARKAGECSLKVDQFEEALHERYKRLTPFTRECIRQMNKTVSLWMPTPYFIPPDSAQRAVAFTQILLKTLKI